MGRKTDDADVKKECPSCGLGVALDARICEFCGWDFDEEDEWILQIEKLERDLVLEKQKFEPGTVGNKIEASLHAPAMVKREQIKASAAKARLQQEMEEVLGAAEPQATPHAPPEHVIPKPATREARDEEVAVPERMAEEPVDLQPVIEQPKPVAGSAEGSSSGKVRRVRKVKGAQAAKPSAPKVMKE